MSGQDDCSHGFGGGTRATLTDTSGVGIPGGVLAEEGEARVELIAPSERDAWRFLAAVDADIAPDTPDAFARPRLRLKTKGFLFRLDMDYFAPASVFVLLTHLAQSHDDVDYLARLSKAALAIGIAGSLGTINRRNVQDPALAAATTGWYGGVESN